MCVFRTRFDYCGNSVSTLSDREISLGVASIDQNVTKRFITDNDVCLGMALHRENDVNHNKP